MKHRDSPLRVLTNHGVFVRAHSLEPRHEVRVARVAHHHTQVAQPAAILRAFDGRVAEGAAEVVFGKRGEVFETRIEQ